MLERCSVRETRDGVRTSRKGLGDAVAELSRRVVARYLPRPRG
jgi:hypothetical protein